MSSETTGTVIRIALCFAGFVAAFVLVGSFLSQYLFIWFDSASNPSFSQTVLWLVFAAFGVVAAGMLLALSPHPVEGLAIGVLSAMAAGGLYALGYANILIVLVFAVVAGAVAYAVKLGPVRAGYLAVCVGLLFSLGSFGIQASSLSRVAGLTYSSSASETVTNADWATMSATQRESYLAGVIQTEVSRLNIGSVQASQAILPRDVLATVGKDGTVLVNYAAVRVVSPDPTSVASYEQTNDTDWVYESLTSPDDITEAVIHAMAHVYQSQRVSGQISEQRTWPYEDADNADGTNDVLDEWRANLPVDPANDVAAYDNKLESQAWGYASNRIGDYVK